MARTSPIEYGRPALKGRTPGKDVDPYEGKEWRTGADEQTTLITDKPLKFGTLSLPRGALRPPHDSRQGHVAADCQQAREGLGHSISCRSGDLGRAPMTMGKVPKPDEHLTISIEDTPTGGMLHIDWGTTRASIPFTVG